MNNNSTVSSKLAEVVETQPTVLITGFLGAGKTTLLKDLLSALKDKGIESSVILNDYADASIDCATLNEFSENVEPLTATCACCEGLDFLLDLSVRATKSDSDLLFIELNGTADPVPIVESFTLLEEKLRLFPRWQICVIDVRNFGNRGAYSDIEELQLQTASHIYFTHCCDAEVPADIMERVKRMNAHASVMDKQALVKAIYELSKRTRNLVTANDVSDAKVALSQQHLRTHEITAYKLAVPEQVSEKDVKTWLAALPASVIRVKLLVTISERTEERYLYERVGNEISPYMQRVKLNANVPNSAILIGPDLNVKELEDLSAKYLFSAY